MRVVLILAFGIGLAGCAQGVASTNGSINTGHGELSSRAGVIHMADFTGRTAAVDSVEVRAHVSGYLDKVKFKEGALVRKDDVLFEIDPRPYRADLNRAKGSVEQFEARVRSSVTTSATRT